MVSIFRYDSKFFEVLAKVTDFVVLNLIFIISCIPIITIGASVTSMYTVSMKRAKDDECSILKTYIKSFKENFKASTKVWILMMIIGGVLVLDFQIANMIPVEGLSLTLRLASTMVSVIFIFALTYIFPIISKFENTMKNTIINSVLMSIQNLPLTIMIVILNLLPLILLNLFTGLWGRIIFFYMILGFGTTSYLNSILFNKIFSKYIS